MQIKPARIIIASFLIAIFIGTCILLLPISTYKGISLIDALFTATSAVCVTGLIVHDTPTFFTPFGKWVILLLFQLGGLGIMTFSTMFALMVGRGITIKERRILTVVFENEEIDLKLLLRWIFLFTFLLEGAGFVLLRIHWRDKTPFYALFHAISAFCNAGFSLYSDSFQGFRSDLFLNLIVTLLIIVGGMGFLASFDLVRFLMSKLRRKEARLALHTKIVLVMTLILISLGTLLILSFEEGGLFRGYPLKDKLLASYFQSVTARTAGFNTVQIDSLKPASKLLLIALMFVGASPGSTGGGIKTVTFALVILGILSILKGKKQIRVFRRAVPLEIFEKAIVIFVLSIGWILIATMLLLLSEGGEFLKILFEVVSAFGTVGLSCGITSSLTPIGKFIIILTMFFGRIGPMTLAIALAGREEGEFRLPEEKVMVG
jgi:trk system potassium uptake protein TrkH